MSGKNQKIDFVLRQWRRKNIFLGAIILAPLILFSLWFYLPPLGEISEVSGTVTRLVNESGEDLYLVVKLANGEIVRSYIPNSLQYKREGKVKLQKREALFFGKARYIYMGYAEKNA